MAQQVDRAERTRRCDYVLTNDGSMEELQAQVDALWPVLKAAARAVRV
jgi:dephospho-CoA kinase